MAQITACVSEPAGCTDGSPHATVPGVLQTPSQVKGGSRCLNLCTHQNFVFLSVTERDVDIPLPHGLCLSCSCIKYALFILKLRSLWSFIPHTLDTCPPGSRAQRPHGTAILTAGLLSALESTFWCYCSLDNVSITGLVPQ